VVADAIRRAAWAWLERPIAKLSDPALAPSTPLRQLCLNSIVHHERIAEPSLDLKETDRYGLLGNACGANDADG
jgi:hypothetical protein